MGHNFERISFLPLEEITVINGPKTFGGLRKGWWNIEYKNKKYKFFGQVISPEHPEDVGYDQIRHIKELAAEAIVLNTVEEVLNDNAGS